MGLHRPFSLTLCGVHGNNLGEEGQERIKENCLTLHGPLCVFLEGTQSLNPALALTVNRRHQGRLHAKRRITEWKPVVDTQKKHL